MAPSLSRLNSIFLATVWAIAMDAIKTQDLGGFNVPLAVRAGVSEWPRNIFRFHGKSLGETKAKVIHSRKSKIRLGLFFCEDSRVRPRL